MIDRPFPFEGTVTPRESGYSADLPCESEWLTEQGHDDYLQQAVDRVAREHGNDVSVDVVWYGKNGECTGFELLGRVEE